MKDCIKIVGGKTKFFLDNRESTESAYRERYPAPKVGRPAKKKRHGNWPMKSDSMAVLRRDIPAVMEHDKAMGVPTQYDRVGRPILNSQRHFNAYAKAHGLVHKGSV